jgi:peptidoglycan/xylan/chitin deacetylase (PgdA/CDA1 family)
MKVLSYHRFVDHPDDYRFSRTYEQFYHDLRKKEFDLITIDDAQECMLRACAMMTDLGIRAKLFIPTELVGKPGYCTWAQLIALSSDHDIENHGSDHRIATKMTRDEIILSMNRATLDITREIGKRPEYFVAPFNTYTPDVYRHAALSQLICLEDRETILNISK